VSAVKPAAEAELRAVEGYVPDSLEIDTRAKRVSLKIVVGSSAGTEAKFALLRGRLFTTPLVPTRRR